jgi:hypothetical protein
LLCFSLFSCFPMAFPLVSQVFPMVFPGFWHHGLLGHARPLRRLGHRFGTARDDLRRRGSGEKPGDKMRKNNKDWWILCVNIHTYIYIYIYILVYLVVYKV